VARCKPRMGSYGASRPMIDLDPPQRLQITRFSSTYAPAVGFWEGETGGSSNNVPQRRFADDWPERPLSEG
jgi:hypothetical protein